MRLVPNWKRVLRHSWSTRLMYLSAALSGVGYALPYLDGILPLSPQTLALLTLIASAVGPVFRVIAQENVSGPAPEAE